MTQENKPPLLLGEEEIEEIERAANEANRGPWRMWGMQVRGPAPGTADDDPEVKHTQLIANTFDEERGLRTFNGQFICMARTAVPRLIATIRELQKQINSEQVKPVRLTATIEGNSIEDVLAQLREVWVMIDLERINESTGASPSVRYHYKVDRLVPIKTEGGE